MKKSFRLLGFAMLTCSFMAFCSCVKYKDITYFQNVSELEQIQTLNDSIINYEARITPDDMLGITVSSIDPNSVAPFNLPVASFMTPGDKSVNYVQNLQSYLVDKEGYINFPVLGKIKVGGLTKQECISLLQNKIKTYVNDPIVNLQILNFKIIVLGEVNRPGTQFIPNDRASILDVIGYAGDLTVYGERENILLIRDHNGKKEFHRFNLNQTDLFASPYYYLQQNDVIYVSPNVSKQKNARYNQRDAYNVSLFSAIVGTASVIVSLVIALWVK